MVKEKFLDKFRYAEPVWEEVIQGRAGVLHLGGKECQLDIWATCFPTGVNANSTHEKEEEEGSEEEEEDEVGNGNGKLKSGRKSRIDWEAVKKQRSRMREIISRRLMDQSYTLSLIGGDFNTVTEEQDRWSEVAKGWTGRRDAKEEAHWKAVVEAPNGLVEIRQGDKTYKGPKARSRLDRAYTNQHRCCQQDMQTGCVALKWPDKISDNRPVVLFRRAPVNIDKDKTFRNPAAYKHKGWPKRRRWPSCEKWSVKR